jgi:hypothetical protein
MQALRRYDNDDDHLILQSLIERIVARALEWVLDARTKDRTVEAPGSALSALGAGPWRRMH